MTDTLQMQGRYRTADTVVAREIEGEMLIIPLVAGVGDLDDDIFTLNESGRAIWDRLDGQATLEEIAEQLSAEFDAPLDDVRGDVQGFVAELLKRDMVAVAE